MAPKALLSMPRSCWVVIDALRERGRFSSKAEATAGELGISLRTFREAVRRLERAGLVEGPIGALRMTVQDPAKTGDKRRVPSSRP